MMKKRTYTAEFKTKVVLELISGEKELNVIASENEIAPNQIRNWKTEFLSNAAMVFDKKHDNVLQNKLSEKEKEADELSKAVGQLTLQVNFLKKTLERK